jgi:hypothetical protein
MKIKIAVFILLAFFVFTGASPWEGAAATAPEGELPAKGRYVATNSFPRNTVVDILNLETNRSTRVIVSGGLESPGLLALVSREAAELIGMRAGSVSRIRMTQPSDPIAYLRFKDGVTSGIPDYDSGNVMTEEKYREEWYREEPAVNSNPPSSSVPPVVAGAPPYFLEPEWSRENRHDIINLPQDKEDTTELGWMREDEDAEEIEESVVEAEEEPETEAEEIADVPEEETPETEEIAQEEAVEPVEEIAEETTEEPVEEIAEETTEEPVEEIAEQTEEQPPPEWENAQALSEYTLVPAEENPPVNDIYGIDPSSIISGIAMPDNNTEPEAEIATEPVRERPSNGGEQNFSVPRIYELDRGRYYVQVAAHDSPESVESTINHIDSNYKPVVYKDGDNWYRVLLGGPGGLNQGESAAILKRFKSIGYKDAFVRHVR